ncbi:MAG: hypothetical protein ABJJ37_16140 [Roseibium sp.]
MRNASNNNRPVAEANGRSKKAQESSEFAFCSCQTQLLVNYRQTNTYPYDRSQSKLPDMHYASLARMVLIGSLLIAFSTIVQADANCLRLLSIHHELYEKIVPSLQAHLQGAGTCFTVEKVAASRGTLMLKQGKTDGELFRTRQYMSSVEGIAVIVPEAFAEGFGLMVASSQGFLEKESYLGEDIAIVRGVRWQELMVPKESQTVIVEDNDAGLLMLRKKRVSALLIDNVALAPLLEPDDKFAIKRITPKISAHLYLHVRHKDLVPHINQAILEWKTEFYRSVDGL